VALALGLALDVVLIRKLGAPSHPELAMGAIGEDGVRFLDQRLIAMLGVTPDEIDAVERAERVELERRAIRYRDGSARVALAGRAVLVIDDGLATGASARAACRVVRAHGASRVLLAVPIAPRGWEQMLTGEADEFITVAEQDFRAVGELYDNFDATRDEEVIACLSRSRDEFNRRSGV
jgi:predicted phosphoribosyltransferase